MFKMKVLIDQSKYISWCLNMLYKYMQQYLISTYPPEILRMASMKEKSFLLNITSL